jgi:hypothetical protein
MRPCRRHSASVRDHRAHRHGTDLVQHGEQERAVVPTVLGGDTGSSLGRKGWQAGQPTTMGGATDMALYAALVYLPADDYWTDQPEDVHEPSPEYADFAAQASAAGVMRGGEALYPPEMATTIRVADGQGGGDVIITDGPYAEAKEVLGGFFLIEAADLDEATRWASKIPAAWEGGKVELRPVVPMHK